MPKHENEDKKDPPAAAAAAAAESSPWHNQERCRALLECQEQMNYWKARYQRLKQEQRQLMRHRALQTDASAAWDLLTKQEKTSARVLCTILNESPTLPGALKHSHFWANLPKALHTDADLWRARLQRADCYCPLEDHLTLWETEKLRLPLNGILCHHQHFAKNMDLWEMFLSRSPSLLCIDTVQAFLGNPKVVPYEWLRSLLIVVLERNHAHYVLMLIDEWGQSKPSPNDDSFEPLSPSQQRALQLRNDRVFQDRLWRRPTWARRCRGILGPTLRNDKTFCLQLPALSLTNHNTKKGEDSCYFPPDALHALSPRLRADKEVVLVFCQRHGGNLAHTTYGLRRHYAVVAAACRSSPRSIALCTDHALRRRLWEELSSGRQFWESIPTAGRRLYSPEQQREDDLFDCQAYKYAPKSQVVSLWKACPMRLKHQRQTLIAAARVGLDAELIYKCEFAKDVEFWMEILQVDPDDMPDTITAKPRNHDYPGFYRPVWPWNRIPCVGSELARQWLHYHGVYYLQQFALRHRAPPIAIRLETEVRTSIVNLLDSYPHLVADEFFLDCLLSSQYPDRGTLLRHMIASGLDLQQCRPSLERGCRANGYLLESIPLPLQADEGLVQIALQSKPEALTILPETIQIQYPHLVAKAIEGIARKVRQYGFTNVTFLEEDDILGPVDEGGLDVDDPLDLEEIWENTDYFDLEEYICIDLWESREVALAWLRAGGEVRPEFEDFFPGDEEIALVVLENDPDEFQYVATSAMLHNEDFMRRAVVQNGVALLHARGSTPLVVKALAFATHPDMVKNYEWSKSGSRSFNKLTEVAREIREPLLVHEAFEVFLRGFHPAACASPVALLARGWDTSYVFQRTVAEFLGSPLGEELRLLRQASHHLDLWGF